MFDARALDALAEECGGGAVGVMPSPIWRWAQHEAGSSEVAGGGATLRKTNQYRILNPLCTCVFGREQAIMLFGKIH